MSTVRTPASTDRPPEAGPFLRLILPLLLLFLLLTTAGVLVASGLRYVLASEASATQEQHFVFRRLDDALTLGDRYRDGLRIALVIGPVALGAAFGLILYRTPASQRKGWRARWRIAILFVTAVGLLHALLAQWFLFENGASGYLWLHVLVPVFLAGLVAMVWLYARDSATVGWAWATFLASLRAAAYLALALIFLLPAWQNWEKNETRSKVVLLHDVSGSMDSRDGLPTEGVPVEKMPTRQDHVIHFLGSDSVAFINRLQEKNPVVAYRFGGRLDDDFKLLDRERPWASSDWAAWLKPDPKEPIPEGVSPEERKTLLARLELNQQLTGGTNVGDALLALLNREANNMLQGIVVVSDGRSTLYSTQAFDEVRARARKAKVPVFTVAVGEHRQPVAIRITDLQAPEQARPDDRFPVRVEIDGEGLPDKEVAVTLEVTAPGGEKKQALQKPAKFSAGAGGPPHAQVEFDVDAAQLGTPSPETKKPELAEGEWVFRARIARDKREVFLDPEHVSEKATVQVVKKPLRVLLFAGAASRDYQFVRTLLVREADTRRAEVSICLQIQREGVVQDVPPDRLLKHFPDRFRADDAGADKAEEKYYNLAQYDVIIAFDPDWTQLAPEQFSMLERWVNTHAGGLIVVAGSVNTYQMARPGNRERLKPLLDLFPVTLQDARLQGIADRAATEPWRLNFPGATAEMEFLKLDEEAKGQLAGWEAFFTGNETVAASGTTPAVQRGFYGYYPVDSVKPSATVVATFADPRARLRDDKEQPYLVTMPYGSGKTVYLGGDGMWRLRQYREVFHERFWMKLARYAGSGTMTRLSSRGVLVMGREFTAGQLVRLEAQLWGRDLQALSKNAVPKVRFTQAPPGSGLPQVVELQPKPAQADWRGWFQGRFRVLAPGEYRLELQVPDTGDVLPGRFLVKEANPELDNTRPDFGQLYQLASEAGDVLPRIHDRQATNDLLRELEATAARLVPSAEDRGAAPGKAEAKAVPRLFFDLTSARLIPNCMITDVKLHKSRGPFEDLWDKGTTLMEEGSHRFLGFEFTLSEPLRMSFSLLAVVLLLSSEWLTRKLLKLA